MKKLLLPAIIICCLLAVFGCFDKSADSKQAMFVSDQKNQAIVQPVDCGHGVYYFDATGKTFARSLSAFIEKHPELEMVDMEYDNNYFGFCVVFKEKAE